MRLRVNGYFHLQSCTSVHFISTKVSLHFHCFVSEDNLFWRIHDFRFWIFHGKHLGMGVIWNEALPSEQTHKVTRKSCKIITENNCIAWPCWCSALPCPVLSCPALPYPPSPPSLYPTFPTIPCNLPSPSLQRSLSYHPLYRTLPSSLPYPALLHFTTHSPPLPFTIPYPALLPSSPQTIPSSLPYPPLYLTLLCPTPLHSTNSPVTLLHSTISYNTFPSYLLCTLPYPTIHPHLPYSTPLN